jgi:hypothetical protein
MPCGYVRTGKLKEHVAHYRTCNDPACKARLAAFKSIKTQFQKDQTK